MPPFLPRKRRSLTPQSVQSPPAKRARLTDALDAEATNNVPSLGRTKTFSMGTDDSEDESSLSDVDSDVFEDIPVKTQRNIAVHAGQDQDDEDEEEEEDDVQWEDADTSTIDNVSHKHTANTAGEHKDIQITLRKDDEIPDYSLSTSLEAMKKGPSKREKEARLNSHKLHVQYLLWHNAIRNSWIGDKIVQETLVKQLPSQILKEVDKWRRASGILSPEPEKVQPPVKGRRRRKNKAEASRNQRDWGGDGQRLEAGRVDPRHGDPLIMLLKILSKYWKTRFAITAPGLRKRGYSTKQILKQEIWSYRNEPHNQETHGERITDLKAFRKLAEKCEGSRDLGAQLFTALLRGLDIEARLVASLQPCGFGFTKAEQMAPKRSNQVTIDADSSDSDSDGAKPEPVVRSTQSKTSSKQNSTRKANKKKVVIDLDTDVEKQEPSDSDDESIIDVTPSMPKQQRPKYDRDLYFPFYWTEAISPITNLILPVSPLVLQTPVASTPEALSTFEPRGIKADKVRQVMSYVIAFSSDGSAKDVTVRYLRKRMWPGKTKGLRIGIEKVPIYSRNGKIKGYYEYDWFKYVMSVYRRPDDKRTAVDDKEDTTDLVPQEPEKKDKAEEIDTLQSLKASADYTLERFLRREEALRPGSKPVRTFVSGKGDKYKEEPVYRQADVERCLTAESWHKEGRQPKLGETPMKLVPVRAVTLTRKREAEEHERQTGEKQMQGLYSMDQTEYIIPPPIEDGVIPKNAYGNMDCFVPSMVPQGAVHVPLRGTVRICKKLEIDYAEAVTGFEFGNKRAVPVCTGVVVAQENERLVKEAWHAWNEEQKRKEDAKLQKTVLDLWRKFCLGLRIRERIAKTYGQDLDAPVLSTGMTTDDPIDVDGDDTGEGGFMKEDLEGSRHEQQESQNGGGFLLPHEDDMPEPEDLVMDDHQPVATKSPAESEVDDEEVTESESDAVRPSTKQRKQTGLTSRYTFEKNVEVASESDGDSQDDLPNGYNSGSRHTAKTKTADLRPNSNDSVRSTNKAGSSAVTSDTIAKTVGQKKSTRLDTQSATTTSISRSTRPQRQSGKSHTKPRSSNTSNVSRPDDENENHTDTGEEDEDQTSSDLDLDSSFESDKPEMPMTTKNNQKKTRSSQTVTSRANSSSKTSSTRTPKTQAKKDPGSGRRRAENKGGSGRRTSTRLLRKESTFVTSPHFE